MCRLGSATKAFAIRSCNFFRLLPRANGFVRFVNIRLASAALRPFGEDIFFSSSMGIQIQRSVSDIRVIFFVEFFILADDPSTSRTAEPLHFAKELILFFDVRFQFVARLSGPASRRRRMPGAYTSRYMLVRCHVPLSDLFALVLWMLSSSL